jgi:hypothetical protein
MQCTKCGAELAPFANGCVTCATPPPTPPDLSGHTRATADVAKNDISWLAFILISLPFLLVAAVRTYALYPSDDTNSQGVCQPAG